MASATVLATYPPVVLQPAGALCEAFMDAVLRLVANEGFGVFGEGRLAIEPLRPTETDAFGLVGFRLAMPSVHPAVWRATAGGLAARAAQAITIDDPAAHRTLTWDDLLRFPRLRASRPASFAVEETVNPNRAERLVQLTFKDPLTEATASAVRNAMTDWSLLLAGGFPLSGTLPGETAVGGIGPCLVDRFTIEYRVNDADHDDEAYEVLLNLAAFLHRRIAPLEVVAIE